MATSKNRLTLKIILSYLVLGTLAVLVGMFLYSEFEKLTSESIKNVGEKKIVETGTLINLVYEADGFSRLALLTGDDSDFESYMTKTDSLFLKIKEIKMITTNDFQVRQLDSVKSFLIEKNQNIEQLRILRLTNKKDTSLDEIMKEVQKLEASIGIISVETLLKEPSKLSRRERRIWQSYADYLNSNPARDTTTVKSKVVDSMLTASRYIVSEAKRKNSRIREALQQKENELIKNDLKISERLREIIESFDTEIVKRTEEDRLSRIESIERTGEILKFSGLIGTGIVLFFSYLILADFFKTERYKESLEESKNYAESLLKSREQLISGVSHDLKTPLNTISGYAELFENSPLTDKQRYYLSQITSSSKFITQLVDDLLDFSKLEAGKLPLDSIPFSLENIVLEAGNAVKQVYPEKPIELKINIDKNVQGRIFESDPLRIRQILNNLIGNAFKFTQEGSVEIKVDELQNQRDISHIRISVIDTGIGISKEKQNLIFNEFTQAETDIAHKFGGSGLGLAISKKLTQLLHGEIKVSSILGEGSTFLVELPLKIKTRKVVSPKPKIVTTFNGLKAVIIDDDDAMRSLLREVFQQLKIKTNSFGSYQTFKERFGETKFEFDFILTDIQMPDTDGFRIVEKLNAGDVPNYNQQPIIAMTGSREHSKQKHLDHGFAEMLAKPFTSGDLVSVLKHLFPDYVQSHQVTRTPSATDSQLQTKPDDIYDLNPLRSFLNTPQSLNEVLQVFEAQTKTDLIDIKEAVNHSDLGAIKHISHRMLTMTKQLKARKIIPILEKMERYGEPEKQLTQGEIKSDFLELQKRVAELFHALSERPS